MNIVDVCGSTALLSAHIIYIQLYSFKQLIHDKWYKGLCAFNIYLLRVLSSNKHCDTTFLTLSEHFWTIF